MTTVGKARFLAPETIVQLGYILDKLFTDGQQWVKSVGNSDWRRTRYVGVRARRSVGTGPSVSNVVDDIQPVLGYLAKEASDKTGMVHSYMIVKAENGCLKEDGIALFRPVLKSNLSNEPQLNFHIWFHCMPAASLDDHMMVGWRLEAPEGGTSIHNFFHAQPLRDFEGKGHGVHPRFPERFPTIPLPASNVVELCLTAVLVACGREALRAFVNDRRNPEVHTAAKALWEKIFVFEAPGNSPIIAG